MRLKILEMIFLLLLFSFVSVNAGPWDEQNQPAFEKPTSYSQSRYIFKIYNHAPQNRALSQVDLHWGVVNDLFQFVKTDNEFVAGFDLNIELFDDGDNFIDSRFISREIKVDSYKHTNSNTISYQGKFTFSTRPGNYQIRIELIDQDTKKSLVRKQEVVFGDFTQKRLALSDIYFVQKLEDSLSIWQNQPNLAANFSDSSEVWLAFYEIYPPEGGDTVSIITRIEDVHEHEVFADTQIVKIAGPVSLQKIDIHSLVKQPGRFNLTVMARSGKRLVTEKQHFSLTQTSDDPYISSIDDIIEPLKVIGKPDELKKIEEVPETEKRRLIKKFWEKRDPTPETESNEIKEEFYRRVEFCYKNFTVHFSDKPGWKTDRGRVFLRFGEPSLVQKYVSEINRPATEIWYYDLLHRRFMFVDKDGKGDFELEKIE